jgi:hypothetical protein
MATKIKTAPKTSSKKEAKSTLKTSSKKQSKPTIKTNKTTKEFESSYPRPRYVFDEQKIVKLVKENPSREGTHAHENWEMIKNGMSVAKYLENGGSIKDLRANLHRGNIELK